MTVSFVKSHWHCATGIAGYGPDAADGDFAMAHTVDGLCDMIRWELDSGGDYAHEEADSLAEVGQFEEAWASLTRSRELDTLRANLDPQRRHAPLYAQHGASWAASVLRIVSETFPVDYSEYGRIYVWECGEDCDDE